MIDHSRLILCAALCISPGILATEKTQTSETAAKTFFAEGWAGKTGFGYALNYPRYQSGIFQFAEVGLETERHRFMASSEMSGIFEAGNIKQSNGVLNAGYDITWDRWRLFAFTNYEFGVIVGLESNAVLGAGARYTLIKLERVHFDISAAPIYDRAAYADGTSYEALSASLRGRIKIFFTEHDSVFFSWFFIRGLDNQVNQWHAADLINSLQLSRKVSLRLGYRWRYDVFTENSSGLAYLIAVFSFL